VAEGFGLQGLVEILEKVKPGDEIILDNSNFIALQTYHRHQVPSIDFKVWDQYRDEDGKPLYPQRPVLIGPMMAEGGAGSIQSGCFEGKMIVVASLLDSAFPWQPDWYRTKIKEHLGNEEYKHFRLWYMDNAIHNDEAKTADDLHCISYLGALHQALLDLSAWVERGIEPADSTQYSVSDGQIIIPLKANERKGIQPVVTLKANGSQCVEVSVGDNVHFLAEVEVPHNTGKLTAAEWSFEGDINYPIKGNFTNINDDYTIATVEADYVFSKPGTYFPVVRVKSNREGDLNNIFTQVKNLCRVRVIVR
jgi:hypothetical protein